MNKTKYYILMAGEWLKCKQASPARKGWLEYELEGGVVGLARPGKWKKE